MSLAIKCCPLASASLTYRFWTCQPLHNCMRLFLKINLPLSFYIYMCVYRQVDSTHTIYFPEKQNIYISLFFLQKKNICCSVFGKPWLLQWKAFNKQKQPSFLRIKIKKGLDYTTNLRAEKLFFAFWILFSNNLRFCWRSYLTAKNSATDQSYFCINMHSRIKIGKRVHIFSEIKNGLL